MKVILVLAHFLSPTKGSEFSVAWNYITNMSKSNKIIVLYGSSNGIFHDTSDLRIFLKDHKIENVQFIEVKCRDSFYCKLLFKIYNRKNFLFDVTWNLIYKEWQKAAYQKGKALIKSTDIDIIHYLSPIGFKEPGYLWKLDKPYIWGPVKGVDKRPKNLYKALSTNEIIKTIIRNELLAIILKYSNRVRKVMKRAEVIITAVPSGKDQFKRHFNIECEYMPENGINFIETSDPIFKRDDEKLCIIWIGRLDYNKALSILLDSLIFIKDKNWELHVIGDGDLKARLVEQAMRNNINNKLVWHGQIERMQVQKIISKSHLHIITSLGEGNPTTIWETMSKGIPTLTLDHCGMSGTICENCGIKIPISTYQQTTQNIALRINELINDPEAITRLSKGVLNCANQFTWDKRIEFFNYQYDIALERYNKKKTPVL